METAEAKPRPPVPVHITVLRAHNLKGLKGDSPVTYLRSEFNHMLLGDSPKLEAAPNRPTDYNFTSSFDVGPDTPHTLDDVAHCPVVVTVTEILPKEKKQKEEKMAPLGQATVDLLPLLKGECNFVISVLVSPTPGSPLESLPTDIKASLEVAVSVPEPLLSELQMHDGNLLRVTMEAAYCTPEAWHPQGPPYLYVSSLQLPSAGETDLTLIFSNGVLKAGGEGEAACRHKRWPVSGIAAPGALHIPETFILSGAYEEENGEINRKEDKELRREAETHKKRVMWDAERRCYLDKSAVISFQKQIAERRYWPVEIMRAPVPAPSRAKPTRTEKSEEDVPVSFHGVAYVNMVPLLYPGVTRLRGAYRVLPYQEADVLEKTKRRSSIMRELLRHNSKLTAAPSGFGPPPARPPPSRIGREEKGLKEKEGSRRMSAVARPSDAADPDPNPAAQPAPLNVEGQQYAESGTYLVLEISLEKPLVPKRLPEEMELKVKELVPPRPQLDRRTATAQKAVADYHSQVTNITKAILEEYCDLFGQQDGSGLEVDPQVLEEQKCQLNYELNCSGKYFAFKEQLKHAVVKIVREKYLRTTAFEERDQLQAFLSDLYIYLVDQMHIALNKTLSDDREEPPPHHITDSGQLLRFAKEAEMNEDYNLAEMYYKERLARDRHCADHWLDYGSLKLLTGDDITAQECFREALLLKRNDLESLLLCGVAAVLLDNNSDAEVFFEDAACVHSSSPLAWTMLGLFYEIQGNDIRMEMAFSEAGKLQQAELALERSVAQADSGLPAGGESNDPGAESSVPHEPSPAACSVYLETAKFLSRVNATQLVRRALAHELLAPDGGPSCRYHLMCAQINLLRKEYEAANEHLQEASRIDHQNPDVWALTGHLRYASGRKGEARECYQHALNLVSDASEMHPVYLRLGSIYLHEGEYEKAKNTYLLACKQSPTCLTWLGAGIACYRLEEMQEAEEALSEANALNNSNPEVWAYLTLVCLKTGRQLEAEQSYKYTRKLNFQDRPLLTEIHQLQEEVGFGDPSF